MKMKVKEESREQIRIYAISGTIICCVVFLFRNWNKIMEFVGQAFTAMAPFLWGFAIAFIMVPEGIDMTLAAADLLFEEFTYPRRGEVPPVSDMAVLVGSGAYYIEGPIFAELRAEGSGMVLIRVLSPGLS